MDLVVGVEGVQVLGLVKIPEHGGAVLATGGAEGAVGGDGDGVDVSVVAHVVGLQLAAGEFPDLFVSSLVSEPQSPVLVDQGQDAGIVEILCSTPTIKPGVSYENQAKVISLSHGQKRL